MYADTWADLEASACPTCPMTLGLTQHRRDPDERPCPRGLTGHTHLLGCFQYTVRHCSPQVLG